MKTQIRSLLTLICAASASLISQTVCGQVPTPTPNSIVITEDSSTSLTATYFNGTTTVTITPTFLFPDNWTVQFPGSVNLRFSASWIEPENSALANNVFTTPAFANDLNVASDAAKLDLGQIMDEGTVSNVGIDTSNGQSISITFDDDAATAEVPDTGSTLGLLSLALAALFGASHFRPLRLA